MIQASIPATNLQFFHHEPPFLPFWAWSALLHVGILALFSFVHFTPTDTPKQSVVKVTLVDTGTPAPTPLPREAEPKPAEPASAPPPPLETRRPMTSPSQPSIPQPQALPLPSPQTTIATVAPPPTPRRLPTPNSRRVLQDQHAVNTLNMKSLLKVPPRLPLTRQNSPLQQPNGGILSAAIPTPPPTISSPSSPSDSFLSEAAEKRRPPSRSATPHVLKANIPQTGTISKSKVGLGRTIPPLYPRIARENGWEGTVLVRVAVQPDGRPESVQVRKSSGHAILDDAAIEAVKKWRFIPAKDGNIPIRSVVEIPIHFDLRQQG